MSRPVTVVPLYAAQRAVDSLCELLRPVCDRVRVAGSVRRQRESVHDLEVIVIARREAESGSTLFPVEVNQLDRWCDHVDAGRVTSVRRRRRMLSGRGAPWGPAQKSLAYCTYGRAFAVDLFVTTLEKWGAMLAIRTGPADFSRHLVMQREHGGAMPRGWKLRGGRIETPDGVLDTPTEASFFEALSLPMWEPRQRSVGLLQQYMEGRRHAGSLKTSQ